MVGTLSKGGKLVRTLKKSPFRKGGFRGISEELIVGFFERPLTTNPATDHGQKAAWSIEHREIIANCEFRIAKLGTRPKGGSPKDNFNLQQMTA
jgi:hypothetical protein